MTSRLRPSAPGISAATLCAYGAPAMALSIPIIPVYVQLPSFYATDVGLGLSAVGAALFVARLFDVVTDPLVGLACDAGATRFGKRKPWILVGAIVAAFAMFQLFLPPSGAGFGHLLIWAALLYLGWTLAAIPYFAWGAELSPDYHERAKITSVREGASLLGVLIAGGLLAVAPRVGWSMADSQVALAVAAVAIGTPTIAILLWRVPEAGAGGRAAWRQLPIRDAVRGLHRNPPFLRLMGAWLLNGLSNGLAAVLLPLYLLHGLGVGEASQGLLIFAYFASGVAAIPIWLQISGRIGKHRAWCAAMLLCCAAFIWVPMIGQGDWPAFLAVCVITGIALGADLALPPAMQADVVDYDEWKFGWKRAGVMFALWSLAAKLALAGAVGFAFPVLDLFGFDASDETNTPRALLALVAIYAVIPVVLKLATVSLIWGHPLTKARQAAIRRLMARRS